MPVELWCFVLLAFGMAIAGIIMRLLLDEIGSLEITVEALTEELESLESHHHED